MYLKLEGAKVPRDLLLREMASTTYSSGGWCDLRLMLRLLVAAIFRSFSPLAGANEAMLFPWEPIVALCLSLTRSCTYDENSREHREMREL